ncbi:MAG: acyltransferase [Thermoanaerobaculia bacterium]|nr:acyltransferase [Thermoanaerobaculia bacterium]
MGQEITRSGATLSFLPPTVRGVISFCILAMNTVVCSALILPLALVKLIVPAVVVRKRIDRFLHAVAEGWISVNGIWIGLVRNRAWRIEGVEGLRADGWYLVVSNHQSWADVFILQEVLNRQIPLVKFTLKRRLIWVPFAGLAWWALDFPFMSRHSEEFLRRHPERRGEDLAAIRRACEKYRHVPTAVGSFPEGTRLTPEKHRSGEQEYRYLLRPRAGGVALALDAMGEQFEALVDVTIHYPGGVPTFFGFLSGRVEDLIVVVRDLPIPDDLIGGNYEEDPESRARVREWINDLWREKDGILASLHREKDSKEV